MRPRSQGFTLIELLVVMAIIGFLASALVVAAVGLAARARIEKTGAMIRRLDAGCEAYFTKFQDYPSDFAKLTALDIKGGVKWAPIHSDVLLFDYLAMPLKVTEGFVSTGAPKLRNLEPFVEIKESERIGPPSMGFHTQQIIDAWNLPIWYDLPGSFHGANFPDRTNRFDITSFGADKKTTWDKMNPDDDVCNWTYDRK